MSNSTKKGTVRILHLSDFHFRADRAWDADPVLNALAETIGEFVGDGLIPDVVAITGDIAHSGSTEEYQMARKWIEEKLRPALPSRFPASRILIVPGNHDVDRATVKISAIALQDYLLDSKNQSAIAEVLSDPAERRILLERHRAYLEFVNGLRARKNSLDVPWWSATLKLGEGEQRVHFAGLCSSWMACCDNDKGNLLIGSWQVNRLVKAAKGVDWSIALLHHPWTYLPDFETESVEEAIHHDYDVVLRGHLHRPKARAILSPRDTCVELATGSAYAGSDHANAFQLISLHAPKRTVSVESWLWQERRWIRDRNTYGYGATVALFDLHASSREKQAEHPEEPGKDVGEINSMRGDLFALTSRGYVVTLAATLASVIAAFIWSESLSVDDLKYGPTSKLGRDFFLYTVGLGFLTSIVAHFLRTALYRREPMRGLLEGRFKENRLVYRRAFAIAVESTSFLGIFFVLFYGDSIWKDHTDSMWTRAADQTSYVRWQWVGAAMVLSGLGGGYASWQRLCKQSVVRRGCYTVLLLLSSVVLIVCQIKYGQQGADFDPYRPHVIGCAATVLVTAWWWLGAMADEQASVYRGSRA